ncbi:MBL fold metallo-hydrolase [Venatoribacter cucullus]|uniref:MBL fold metallo-hydrolase n=1 Tax=Venatoribacter cucullus TaxID=2661630 RepID=UPI00223FEEB0|nr:MBL fold metallo-hydrolase [Venatoribacter cucullus]UZK04503.1 MBL fold metallo-hydrolase [Venatoribacter cucullus]
MSLSVAIIPVTAFAQNCSILMCNKSKKAAVVDPGGDLERIIEQLQRMGATAEKILLTHAHIDHAGGTAALARQLNVPIEGPQEGDLFWIQGLPNQSAMFGFPPAEVFTPDRWLHDNDTVTVGEVTLQVIHTPGHTPGHVVFYSANDKLAIVGDVLFQGSIGRTDFPQGNHEQLVHSIRAKLFPLGDDITFIPGHGPESTFGQERRTNPFVADHRG